MQLERAMLSPAALRQAPLNGRERALCLFSLRRLWHRLLDPIPKVRMRLGSCENQAFENFLDWAATEGLALDWTFHAWFLVWLSEVKGPFFSPLLSSEDAKEILAASVSEWALSDKGADRKLIMTSHHIAPLGIMSVKAATPEAFRRVLLVKLTDVTAVGSRPQYTFPVEGVGAQVVAWRNLEAAEK